MSTDKDPSGIPRHLGYSGERIRRTRGGRKSDSGADYCVEEDASERQVGFVFFVQCCGRVRLQEDCKCCIFKGSMGYSGGCI